MILLLLKCSFIYIFLKGKTNVNRWQINANLRLTTNVLIIKTDIACNNNILLL